MLYLLTFGIPWVRDYLASTPAWRDACLESFVAQVKGTDAAVELAFSVLSVQV